MAVPKCHPLLNETVEVRGVNVVKAQRVDGVQTLLVRDDEDDVRTVVGHGGERLATSVLQGEFGVHFTLCLQAYLKNRIFVGTFIGTF